MGVVRPLADMIATAGATTASLVVRDVLPLTRSNEELTAWCGELCKRVEGIEAFAAMPNDGSHVVSLDALELESLRERVTELEATTQQPSDVVADRDAAQLRVLELEEQVVDLLKIELVVCKLMRSLGELGTDAPPPPSAVVAQWLAGKLGIT